MNEISYSCSAAIMENGRISEGDLYLDKNGYEFNGKRVHFGWKNTSCIKGTACTDKTDPRGQSLYVVIIDKENHSLRFIFRNQKQADKLAAAVTALEKAASQHYREIIRTYEAGGLRSRDAMSDIISDRKRRISDEVKRAGKNAASVATSQCDDVSIRKAWSYIIDNPYRILGISVTASEEEANASLDKIKKLARLNAVKSFKSRLDLKGLEPPARDLGIAQNAFASRSLKHKWFWFAESDACIAWQDEEFRREMFKDGQRLASYDIFLANYAYALLKDPEFKNAALWRKPVFGFYNSIGEYNADHAAWFLGQHLRPDEMEKISPEAAIQDFWSEIFKPVEELCQTDDAERIIRLCEILKDDEGLPSAAMPGSEGFCIFHDETARLRDQAAEKLVIWFESREDSLTDKIYRYDTENVEITASVRAELIEEADRSMEPADKIIISALKALKRDKARYDRIKKAHALVNWNLVCVMEDVGDADMEMYYARKCYPYCDDETKKRLEKDYGLAAVSESTSDEER